jgi:Na+/melibiose symporter-like transporter
MAFLIFPKSLAADLIVYDRALQGRSRASIINGLLGPISRIGTALGGILVGWLLDIVGYSSGVPLSPSLKDGMSIITGIVPSMLLLLIIPLVLLYPLSKSKMESVEDIIRKNQ